MFIPPRAVPDGWLDPGGTGLSQEGRSRRGRIESHTNSLVGEILMGVGAQTAGRLVTHLAALPG